jgi:transcriptional antiterminator RfaH
MWFVIHSKPREELKAKEHLDRQGFDTFLPMISLEKVQRGRLKVVTEPLFSRYLFVQTNSGNQNFSVIRSTQGVHRMVAFGPIPAQVPDSLVDTLKQLELPELTPLFKQGDEVVLATGPLKGLRGIYQEPNGDKRAHVLIELISKPHLIPVDKEQLLPAPAWG